MPTDRKLEEGTIDDPVLTRIITTTRALLQEAYELCSDMSPDQKMTHQRTYILNEFYIGASGKSEAFHHYKITSSLSQYFHTWVQLIVFYYRVVYIVGGYFTQREPHHQIPEDVIQPTALQQKTFDDVVTTATNNTVNGGHIKNGNNTDNIELQHLLRRFFLTLICHVVRSVTFRSPVLSFCAVLSKTIRIVKMANGEKIETKRLWKKPGHYSSHLSALTYYTNSSLNQVRTLHQVRPNVVCACLRRPVLGPRSLTWPVLAMLA
jgi:hypothetical protein